MPEMITMYGTATCVDCNRSRRLLDAEGAAYEFIDIGLDAEAADRAKAISGRTSTPLIVFADGSFQVEPTDDELRAKL